MRGGLGYWAGNHFRYGPPKFSMNATPQCYDYEIGSPGWSFFYSNEALPDRRLGIAQREQGVGESEKGGSAVGPNRRPAPTGRGGGGGIARLAERRRQCRQPVGTVGIETVSLCQSRRPLGRTAKGEQNLAQRPMGVGLARGRDNRESEGPFRPGDIADVEAVEAGGEGSGGRVFQWFGHDRVMLASAQADKGGDRDSPPANRADNRFETKIRAARPTGERLIRA